MENKKIIFSILFIVLGVATLFFTYLAIDQYSDLASDIGFLLENEDKFQGIKVNGHYIGSFMKGLYVGFDVFGITLMILFGLLILLIFILAACCFMQNKKLIANKQKQNFMQKEAE